METKPKSPTEGQRRILKIAAAGHRVVADGKISVHSSFTTGETWFGFPNGSYRACERNGWIVNERITDLGREALDL